MALKYEGLAIGTRIRAYDFQPMEGRDPCYIEGVIDGISENGFKAYVVIVEKDTEFVNRDVVLVPMETNFDFDGRVVVLKTLNQKIHEAAQRFNYEVYYEEVYDALIGHYGRQGAEEKSVDEIVQFIYSGDFAITGMI